MLVEVETDAGITGIGESVSSLAAEMTTAALRAVEPLFIGQPIHDVGRLVHEARHLGTFNHMPWFADFVLAGFEMALWDAIGKAAGQPVYRLLGGAVRDEVDYFGFVQGDTTDELVEDARDLAAAGYGVIYLKVGRGDEADVRNTAAVREAIGGRRLRVDPNCAWSVPDAIRMIHALEPYGLDWVEQPTTLLSVTAMRQVREAVHVPIAADQAVLTEYDVYDFVRQRACDAICLSARGRRPAGLRPGRRRRGGRGGAHLPARPERQRHHRRRAAAPRPQHAQPHGRQPDHAPAAGGGHRDGARSDPEGGQDRAHRRAGARRGARPRRGRAGRRALPRRETLG